SAGALLALEFPEQGGAPDQTPPAPEIAAHQPKHWDALPSHQHRTNTSPQKSSRFFFRKWGDARATSRLRYSAESHRFPMRLVAAMECVRCQRSVARRKCSPRGANAAPENDQSSSGKAQNCGSKLGVEPLLPVHIGLAATKVRSG